MRLTLPLKMQLKVFSKFQMSLQSLLINYHLTKEKSLLHYLHLLMKTKKNLRLIIMVQQSHQWMKFSYKLVMNVSKNIMLKGKKILVVKKKKKQKKEKMKVVSMLIMTISLQKKLEKKMKESYFGLTIGLFLEKDLITLKEIKNHFSVKL